MPAADPFRAAPGAGRTLAVAVHRPLAEQLAAIAAPPPRSRVLELSDGDGELTRALLALGLLPRSLVCVVAGEPRAASVREAIGGAAVSVVVAPAPPLSFEYEGFDAALSLFALADDDRLPTTLTALAQGTERALVAVWSDRATHEAALRDAWLDVTGIQPDFLAPPAGRAAPRKWSSRSLADVARFDSVGQLWRALVTERDIDVPAGLAAPLRERLAHHVARFTAADGTLRIPVAATLFETR